MEKEILDDLRSRIDELQSQLDALRARLDSVLSEPEDVPFTEPVDISLDDPFIEESVPEAASGLPAAAEGPDSWFNGPSVAQAVPSADTATEDSAGGSRLQQVCPPSDTLEGGAQPSGWEGCSERSERNLSGDELPPAEPLSAGSPEAKEEEMPVEAPKREVTLDYQWTKDIPGGPVSNIISGISLNDRVLLINTLFKEDPLLFQATIGDFNKMECFADACDYIQEHFPDWNLSSETVYRLMMAVRRKLR